MKQTATAVRVLVGVVMGAWSGRKHRVVLGGGQARFAVVLVDVVASKRWRGLLNAVAVVPVGFRLGTTSQSTLAANDTEHHEAQHYH